MPKSTGKADPEALSQRLRAALGARTGLAEKRMFGGLCLLLGGNMLCGASKRGFMVRVGPEQHSQAELLPGAKPMIMRGRPIRGFFRVDPEACDARGLRRWLALAEAYVGKMPAKAPKKRKLR